METLYDKENLDFYFTKGDTVEFRFEIVDDNGAAVDITGYDIKASILDPYDDVIVQMISGEIDFSKQHLDDATGRGIYIQGDAALPNLGIEISAANIVVLRLDYADTSLLENDTVYEYDIEFAFESKQRRHFHRAVSS